MDEFQNNFDVYADLGRVKNHGSVRGKYRDYPLVSVQFGNEKGPALVIIGGVHGLERIGTQLAVSLLESFYQRLQWDLILIEMLEKIQVIFIPLVNPTGYNETTRSNANGVDLMRNAPIESTEKVPFLLGGHKISNRLPWYRGEKIEAETQFVCSVIEKLLKNSTCVISLDIHSGFGFKDQLWFPFANSRKEFPNLTEMFLLFELFEKSQPHHIYKIEPQSKNYLTHGDIWDYCYLNLKNESQIYIPLTLEMGSWLWVKKNPLQIFSKTGMFNPIKEHRIKRTLRRHRPFFDFILHALYSNSTWTNQDLGHSDLIITKARQKYYE